MKLPTHNEILLALVLVVNLAVASILTYEYFLLKKRSGEEEE